MPDMFENIDSSTLQEKFDSIRKSTEAAPKDPKLESEVQAALRTDIKRLQDYAKANPGDKFVKANQDLLKGVRGDAIRAGPAGGPAGPAAGTETWIAVGTVDLSGFVYWGLGGGVLFGVDRRFGFLFGAKGGPDLAVGAFTSVIAGAFVVDPAICTQDTQGQEVPGIGTVYKNSCNFQLGQLGGGAGAVRISFSSLTGTYWGMLGGISGGVSGASLTGQCDLVWTRK
jgi:hypothetical protein